MPFVPPHLPWDTLPNILLNIKPQIVGLWHNLETRVRSLSSGTGLGEGAGHEAVLHWRVGSWLGVDGACRFGDGPAQAAGGCAGGGAFDAGAGRSVAGGDDADLRRQDAGG